MHENRALLALFPFHIYPTTTTSDYRNPARLIGDVSCSPGWLRGEDLAESNVFL